MPSPIPLFDCDFLTSLLKEYRRTMHGLLGDLCDDLKTNYTNEIKALRLPVAFFETVRSALGPEDYSNWRVVGWIEELNDLLYFIDVGGQLRQERRGPPVQEFVSALFDECQSRFYEHHYIDALFPRGKPEALGLRRRLSTLCARIAQQVTQQPLFFVTGLPCEWVARSRHQAWSVAYDFTPNFERAERGGCLYVGLEGAYLEPPSVVRAALSQGSCHARLVFHADRTVLRAGGTQYTLPRGTNELPPGWRAVPACSIRDADSRGQGSLTLGDTLVYGKDQEPINVVPTDPRLADRVRQALTVLDEAWPTGAFLFASLTTRVIPLHARGVVSFSYRHLPGLSFINMFERDQLDLIDDLVHENSHHYLNLLLRKYHLLKEGCHEEVLYSPWRRSLRPVRGILHATFTFTMGALLFARVSSWWARKGRQRPRSSSHGLGGGDVLRARFRGIAEVASVQYSIPDLRYAAGQLNWVTPQGSALVRVLENHARAARRALDPFRGAVIRSSHGRALKRHVQELEGAGRTYRLFGR